MQLVDAIIGKAGCLRRRRGALVLALLLAALAVAALQAAAARGAARAFSVAGPGIESMDGDHGPATDAGGWFSDVDAISGGGFLVSASDRG